MSESYFTSLDRAHQITLSPTAQYWDNLLRALPHGHLLNNPTGFLSDATSISVVHATENLDAIKKNGTLNTAPGCLLSCIYTVPAYVKNGTVQFHNYGSVVFRHKDSSRALNHILITITRRKPITIRGLSYLALGDYYFQLITHEVAKQYPNEFKEALQTVTNNSIQAQDFIKQVRSRYVSKKSFTEPLEASIFIDTLYKHALNLPILTFALFEAASQCIMLLSKDEETLRYAKKGEPNNLLYIHLMHSIASRKFSRFNAGLFHAKSSDLSEILSQGITDGFYKLDSNEFIVSAANQIVRLLGEQVYTTDNSILGHSLYLWIQANNLAITDFLQQRTQIIIQEYWKYSDIEIVYNATTLKGEVGLTGRLDPSTVSIFSLEESSTHGEYEVTKELAISIGEPKV